MTFLDSLILEHRIDRMSRNVRNYQSTPCKIPEDRKSCFQCVNRHSVMASNLIKKGSKTSTETVSSSWLTGTFCVSVFRF
jgi:hypothetical protein